MNPSLLMEPSLVGGKESTNALSLDTTTALTQKLSFDGTIRTFYDIVSLMPNIYGHSLCK